MRRQALFGRPGFCDCDGACELVQERACCRGCDLHSDDLGGGTVPIIDNMQRHFDVFVRLLFPLAPSHAARVLEIRDFRARVAS